MCRLFSLLLVLLSPSIWAFELVFDYGAGNGAPFSIIKDGQLTSGLFKDIGESLARELGVAVQFPHAPHKRTSLLLADGTVNSVCMTHPDWIEGSEYLFWSDKAIEDYDLKRVISFHNRVHYVFCYVTHFQYRFPCWWHAAAKYKKSKF